MFTYGRFAVTRRICSFAQCCAQFLGLNIVSPEFARRQNAAFVVRVLLCYARISVNRISMARVGSS